jgi:hypothetical protein
VKVALSTPSNLYRLRLIATGFQTRGKTLECFVNSAFPVACHLHRLHFILIRNCLELRNMHFLAVVCHLSIHLPSLIAQGLPVHSSSSWISIHTDRHGRLDFVQHWPATRLTIHATPPDAALLKPTPAFGSGLLGIATSPAAPAQLLPPDPPSPVASHPT